MPLDYRTQVQKYRRYFTDLGQSTAAPQIRTYAELTFSLIAITFFVVFAIRPTALTIIDLTKDIQSQQQIDSQLDQKISSLNQANLNFQKYQDDLTVLDTALPTIPLPASFLRQIETLISSYQLTLSSLSIQNVYLVGFPTQNSTPTTLTTTASLPTKTVPFSLRVTGDYARLKSFIQDIQNLQRLNLITDLNFRNSTNEEEGASESTPTISLSVTGQIPFFESSSKP